MVINDLTYNRYNNTLGIIQNRLYSVNDVVAENTFTDDIDDQGTFNNTPDNVNIANNYAYDELGNLTKNTQKEIAEIKWTVYGKVQEVIRTNGSSKTVLRVKSGF